MSSARTIECASAVDRAGNAGALRCSLVQALVIAGVRRLPGLPIGTEQQRRLGRAIAGELDRQAIGDRHRPLAGLAAATLAALGIISLG